MKTLEAKAFHKEAKLYIDIMWFRPTLRGCLKFWLWLKNFDEHVTVYIEEKKS